MLNAARGEKGYRMYDWKVRGILLWILFGLLSLFNQMLKLETAFVGLLLVYIKSVLDETYISYFRLAET